MSSEGYLTSDVVESTWIKPYGQEWKKVTYSAVDGLAVFEGCIILGSVDQMKEVRTFIDNNPGYVQPGVEPFGSAIIGVQYRWKNSVVPFEIDQNLPNPQRVHDAIDHWHANTPIKLIPRTGEHLDYVVFRPGNGCASSVGKRGGRQDVVLGASCTAGNCIHEIGHTVGLWHEQSRRDRDQFITINWGHIIASAKHNFDQHVQDGSDLGAYDYGSIMHYPKDAFSSDGSDTIEPKTNVEIGQRKKLSPGDVKSVLALIAG